MSAPDATIQSYVVFSLGERQFALPTADVVELSRTGRVQEFPHNSEDLEGVLVRRGEILPVWNLAKSLEGCSEFAAKMWLVTRCNFAGDEQTAIPVSGECQMFQAKSQLVPSEHPSRAVGILMMDGQPIEILDLKRVRTEGARRDPERAQSEEGKKS